MGDIMPIKEYSPLKYRPAGLYNAMIQPLFRQKIKGVIWYQGESDTERPDGYLEKFGALIDCWRKGWGYDFPFIFTELPYWENATDWEPLRKQQRAALSIKNTGLAFSADAGEYNDLHPQNKKTIGERQARVALRLAYGEQLPRSPYEIIGANE
jgi:sialate O-acetylesterase